MDYQGIKDIIEREREPNQQFLSDKEATEYLRNLYLTNPKNHKHSGGPQL